MWRVISLLLLLLGLAGYSFADDVIDNKCWSYTGVPPSAPNGGGSSLGYMKVPGTNVYENAYTCNAESPRITRFYGDAIYSCPSGTSDVNGVCKNTRPTCSMSNIAARCAAKKGWGLAMSDISSSSMCGIPSAPATMPDDCDPPPGVGCSMTARFNPLGPPLYMDYTGFTCTATAQVADPSNPNSGNMPALPQPLPQSPGNCKSDEYWGTVSANGKTLQGCFGAGPIPSSNAPVADPATGKDANGNCAANYIGTIDSTGAFKCYPNTQPDSNANCPDGWNKISTGQQTVCVDPNSKPGGSGSGSGGSGNSGGNSNNPGTGASSPSNGGSPNASGTDSQDPGKCTGLPDWVCNLGSGLSGPDGGSPSSLASAGGDISSMLDTSDFFGGGSCPAPKVVVVPLYITEWNWTIDYSPFCDIVARLRPAVIACGFLVAVAIILKR